MSPDVAVLVVSDRVAAGSRQDESGPAACEALGPFAAVVALAVVPDEAEPIREHLLSWCDDGVEVVLTLGGTGFSPRDVTPEATRSVIEREAPGLIVGLVVNGLQSTPRAVLSRAVAGIRGNTLIVNLPGSPKGVRESVAYLGPLLTHAMAMLRGEGHEDVGAPGPRSGRGHQVC